LFARLTKLRKFFAKVHQAKASENTCKGLRGYFFNFFVKKFGGIENKSYLCSEVKKNLLFVS
jgi:hypothetical protein